MLEKRYTVLVVDDEPHVTEAMQELLARLPTLRVLTANRGRQALEMMAKNDVTLLMTDIQMPDMTGLELLAEVGQRWPLCKAIVLTGYSDFQYAYESIRMHVSAYILKSEEDDALLGEVCKTLSLPLPADGEDDGPISEAVVQRAEREIRNRMSENLTCAELAQQMGYNSAYLSRLFLRYRKESLSAYISRRKMEHIMGLMRDPRMTFSQIARATGFSSRSYFNRFVHKASGSTPSQLRAMLTKTGSTPNDKERNE